MRKEAVWCGIVCFVIRQNVLSLFFMMLICLTLLTLARSVFNISFSGNLCDASC